ncbi:unnamed protein product [Psylliodes chrysocephalus]|uniref:Uncharacterized protein n=1 Tax=Psylliodes chrysocephalus TaxID=3402493 RepID=A0A9P0D4S9_9CUCU|nr:unnamed protein product [Psylliodes chrysocephala]
MRSVVAVFAVLVMVFGFNHVVARPNNRIKRVSDSHLADLETKIAMNNRIKGFAITLPIGGGKIDPLQISCRRSRRGKKCSGHSQNQIDINGIKTKDDQKKIFLKNS